MTNSRITSQDQSRFSSSCGRQELDTSVLDLSRFTEVEEKNPVQPIQCGTFLTFACSTLETSCSWVSVASSDDQNPGK